jgi:hypothetical protein
LKLSSLKIDSARLEQGAWVDNIPEMGGVRLKVRGAGNAAYRRLQQKLYDAVPRSKKIGGNLDPDEADRITAICMRDTILTDWDGFTNDDGSPVPFDREMAGEMLTDPDFVRFRNAVAWAASVVADQRAEDGEADRGN